MSLRPRLVDPQLRASNDHYYAPSKLACFSSREGCLLDLPLRAAFSPSHPLARRDVPLSHARAFRLSPLCIEGSGRGCPLLRASNEHCFIVRVLRARRAPGRSLPISGRALREHRRSTDHPLFFSQLAPSLKGAGSWVLNCARRTSTF